MAVRGEISPQIEYIDIVAYLVRVSQGAPPPSPLAETANAAGCAVCAISHPMWIHSRIPGRFADIDKSAGSEDTDPTAISP